MSIDHIQELKSIIMSFRVSELAQLLTFCNQSKFGRKSVLQERALELLKKENLTQNIQFKIRELAVQQGYTNSSSKTASLEPLLQDSSSNECTITDSDMSHAINSAINSTINSTMNGYNAKHNVPEYYSMPKFDVGMIGRSMNKINSYREVKQTSIEFKPIPFDDVLYTLVEPTILPSTISKSRFNSYDFEFVLKADEANEISMTREFRNSKFEFHSQIHLRFCRPDPSSAQDDFLPINLTVKLNSKSVPLPPMIQTNKPNVEAKRQAKPIDLTPFCKLSPVSKNHLNITWNQDIVQKNFCFAIFLSRKLTSKDLLDKLNAKGVTDPLVTQKLIINKLTDSDISFESHRVSLNCPLGKMRLRIPVRSSECDHYQCFDAELYLQMNEKKPSWLCPACNKKAEYKTLFIDGLFTKILKEAPSDASEIEFSDDGNWKVVQNQNKSITLTPQRRKIEEVETSSIKKSKPDEEEDVIELSSDSEDDNNNENLQAQPLHMPKLSSFGDSNSNKSLNSFPQFNSSALSSLCSQQPSVLDSNRGHSRNLITRQTSHGTSSFGNFNFPISSSNETNSNMLRGHSSEVISID